jgi:hypothetical protein
MSEHDAHDATEHSILQPVSAPEGRATPKHVDVEGDLRCGWSDEVTAQCGQWPSVRGYARSAFERARGTPVRDDA